VLRRLVQALLALLMLVVVAVLGAATGGMAYAEGDPVDELADRYAPVVVVREQPSACGVGEPYLPTPVTTVLGRSDVVLRGPQGQAISAPTATDLVGKGEGWYLDLPGNPLDPGCDFERWFDEAAEGTPPTVYARVATDPDHAGVLVLQYWFFWTFNDWNDKHEGDWEMVQLTFDASSVEQALEGAPTSVAFAQHEGSETASWTDTKVHKDGEHVAVYPGQGSHAAYYTQAQWFGKSAAAGFGCDNTLAPGVVVRPEVVVLPSEPTAGFEWLEFTGRWGQKAPSFNNGPTGPNTKTQWEHPVSWQLEQGRPDAVALPTVGGPAVTGFCELTEAGSLLFVQVLDKPAVVIGVLAVLLVLIVVGIARTDWFNDDDPELDRERKAGQMAVAAVDLMRRRPTALWLPAVLVAGASVLNLAVAQFLLRSRPGEDLADINGFGSNLFGIGLALLVSFLLLPVVAFGMAVAVEIVDSLARHEEIGARTAFRRVLVHPGGWVVAISVYILVTVLAATWWLLPVALYLLARWAVALPATELEDQGVRAGLRRSSTLTRGNRIRSALIGGVLVWMAFSLPSGIGAVVLLATGWPFWVTNLLSILAAAVLVPAASIGLTLLYYDLRRRAETPEPATAQA
jgi:hypothetical protein